MGMDFAIRALWLAVMIQTSSVVGTVAGLLAQSSGDPIATAILKGGGAAGGTLVLLLAIFHFVTFGRKAP